MCFYNLLIYCINDLLGQFYAFLVVLASLENLLSTSPREANKNIKKEKKENLFI